MIDPTNADQAVELDSVEKEFLTWYLADLNKHRIEKIFQNSRIRKSKYSQ